MTDSRVTLTLLHTNDVHSHFEEASRIAGYIAHSREILAEEQLIVVDCGDFLDRVRLETEGTQGAVNRAVLEMIGYDAALLGNNEGLSYTPEQLDVLFGGMSLPIVCANMTLSETGRCPSWMVPVTIKVKSGVRIGFIGLTVPFNDYYRLLGWNAADPIDTLRKEVKRIRGEVDAIVVLSHLGLRQDERLAATVEGIDLILGGHTHHLLEVPLVIGHTAISAAGKFGSHIGHLKLTFGADNKLLSITGGCLPTVNLPPHQKLDDLVKNFRLQARQRMDRPIAQLSEPIQWRHDAESPLSTLLACAIRHRTGAEIGLVNAGQLLQGLPAGEITEETIHTICPSPINACLIKLQGSLIVQALEESLLSEFQELVIRGFGFRGRVLGTLCFDGLEVEADLAKAPCQRIKAIRVNGVPLDESREYSVGTLDMFTFGVGYMGLKEGHDIRYFLPEFIRELLSQALNDKQWIAESRKPRWLLQARE
jgi:5'-nucleotidase